MDVDTREELAEATALLETAKGPRVRSALSNLVTILKAESGAMAAAEATAVAKAPAMVGEVGDDAVPAAASGSQLPEAEVAPEPKVAAPPAQRPKVEGGVPAAPRVADVRYTTVDRFSWDQGGYSTPKVSVYVPLEGVGAAKDRVSCSFTSCGFDLTVKDLGGKNYRLLQNNLDKDIVPEESKILVKKDKVIVKLQKVKGSYGSYENWANLSAKKAKKPDKSNPQAGLMDMMKDMYDDGDASTKKLIGEAMMKSQQARSKGSASSFDDPSSYGSGSSGSSGRSSSSKRPFSGGGGGATGSGLGDLGGLGGALGGDLGGGLGGAPGNFDDGMDDDDLELGKDNGDGGWGAGGKDDFGFGSAVPPPQASEPVPAAAEEEEEEEEAGDESPALDGAGKAAETPGGGLMPTTAPPPPPPPPSTGVDGGGGGGGGGAMAEPEEGPAGADGGEGESKVASVDSVNALEALDD